jgi:hypothetical protein
MHLHKCDVINDIEETVETCHLQFETSVHMHVVACSKLRTPVMLNSPAKVSALLWDICCRRKQASGAPAQVVMPSMT